MPYENALPALTKSNAITQYYANAYEGNGEQIARGNGDENGDDYNCVCSFCDDSTCNSCVHDSDDRDDYDAWEDVDRQILLLTKTANQSKRI